MCIIVTMILLLKYNNLCNNLRCDNGKQVDVEVVKSLLLVSRIEKPLIVLKGSTHFQEEEELLKEGVAIFRDLDISTHSKSQADEVYQGVDGKVVEPH